MQLCYYEGASFLELYACKEGPGSWVSRTGLVLSNGDCESEDIHRTDGRSYEAGEYEGAFKKLRFVDGDEEISKREG